MINFSYGSAFISPIVHYCTLMCNLPNPGHTGKGCGAPCRRRVGPEQPIDLDVEDYINSAVYLNSSQFQPFQTFNRYLIQTVQVVQNVQSLRSVQNVQRVRQNKGELPRWRILETSKCALLSKSLAEVGEVCILTGVKKGRWSEAIAVGSLAFVERVKGALGIKAMHWEVLEQTELMHCASPVKLTLAN